MHAPFVKSASYLIKRNLRALGLSPHLIHQMSVLINLLSRDPPATPRAYGDTLAELRGLYDRHVHPRIEGLSKQSISFDEAASMLSEHAHRPSSISVVTGRPGTGKSTLLRAIDRPAHAKVYHEFWNMAGAHLYDAVHTRAAHEALHGASLILAGCLPEIHDPDLHLHVTAPDETIRKNVQARNNLNDRYRLERWESMRLLDSICYETAAVNAHYLVTSQRQTLRELL